MKRVRRKPGITLPNLTLLNTDEKQREFVHTDFEAFDDRTIQIEIKYHTYYFDAKVFYISTRLNIGYVILNNFYKRRVEMYCFGRDKNWAKYQAKEREKQLAFINRKSFNKKAL